MTTSVSDALAEKVACGLRQITASMAQNTVSERRDVQDWQDRINGFAAELEAIPPASGVSCGDCGQVHDPDIRCPNFHANMMPSGLPATAVSDALVERVAAAIRKTPARPGGFVDYEDIARAAIAAIPTEGRLERLLGETRENLQYLSSAWAADLCARIDTALQGDTGGEK